VLRVDHNAEQRRQHAIADRTVATWPLPDAMAGVHAELPAEAAAVVMAALTAMADNYREQDRAAAAAADGSESSGADEWMDTHSDQWIDPDSFNELATHTPTPRTINQLRADALVDICAHILTDPTLPKRQGQRPTVQVTGGILTLLGRRNDPGELTDYGPITAPHRREIAADGDWHRFCTAPDTGALTPPHHEPTPNTPPPTEKVAPPTQTTSDPDAGDTTDAKPTPTES
jgi:hypothetical protein